jgi:cell division protease FtsH
MFKRLILNLRKQLTESLLAQTLAHLALLATVVAVFAICTACGVFSKAPVLRPPPDYMRLKEVTSVELEQQLKAKNPQLVQLVFFEKTKDVAVLYKGFEQDKMVFDCDVTEIKKLAADAGTTVTSKEPVRTSTFFEDVRFYWYLIALGLTVWLAVFLLKKRDEFIPCRIVAAWEMIAAKTDQFRERNKWRKATFYYSLCGLVAAGFVLLSASRVLNNPPRYVVPSEYDAKGRTSGWQVERYLAESPRAFERAVVIDGANVVYLQLETTPAKEKEEESGFVGPPAPTAERPGTAKQPTSDKQAKGGNASVQQARSVEARLALFGTSPEGEESFRAFVASLKAAKVPTKKAEPIVMSNWLETMPVWVILLHMAVLLGLVFWLIGIAEASKRWQEEDAPKKAEKGATVGGGVATALGGNTKVKAEDVKTLKDVAGCDEAVEKFRLVAEWLRNARAYNHYGAKLPKGVLLSGPPGTGKTLLARALAGEVGGNFFQAAASEFIEMYVGVGASRVRDLFGKAKAAHRRTGKPSIVFIDEIDAVGKPRSDSGQSGDGERDQTLNQLLTCIQGFDPNNGTLVIAATNRPETLDSALTRSGRFDYKITVDKPDRKGRKAIFGVHARKIELAPGEDRDALYDDLAKRAHDFSGADIELAVNEAVTRAAKRNAHLFAGKSEEEIAKIQRIVTREDLHAGVDQVMYGELIKSRVRSDKERRATAIHEIGHAAIPTILKGDPVSRITIVMTSKSLGLMESHPEEDRYGWSKEQFLTRIKMMLAGRVAEELVGGEVSTGASNDFERASQLARFMVGAYGMSDELGPISLPLDQHGFPRTIIGGGLDAEFNAAWRKIIRDCEEETRKMVKENHARIERVALVLLDEETLTGDRFRELWAQEDGPSPQTPEPQATGNPASGDSGSVTL